MKMIHIAIITPAIAVRAGLRTLLNEDPLLQVVADWGKPSEISELPPEIDVLVWSPGPLEDQAEAFSELQRLLRETTALLMLHDDAQEIRPIKLLKVRAWGILGADATQAELLASVLALNEGLVVASPVWISRLFTQDETSPSLGEEGTEPLTNRELEILQLLALGLTNKQIAVKLKISAHTVKFHLSVIFRKLGTTNRLETVKLGLKNGLIAL